MSQQLATTAAPATASLSEMMEAAKYISESGMIAGIVKPAQAMCLMMICQAEGLNYMLALRRYHIVDGKPSMRADAMQGEFEARGGGILWHIRTDKKVGATFYADKTKIDKAAIERAKQRFAKLDFGDENGVAEYAYPGEETIIRTIEDADAKKVSMAWDRDKKEWKKKHNWIQSPRQMLTARTITEGVRLMNPGLIAGIYSPDEIEDARVPVEDNDANAIRALIQQHQQEAMNTSDANQKARLLGLASDLKLKLEEMGESLPVEPLNNEPLEGATNVEQVETPKHRTVEAETEVLPPEPKDEEPPKWETVKCHIGSAGGKVLGYTMKELFVDSSLKKAQSFAAWFENGFINECNKLMEKHVDLKKEDQELYLALTQALHYVFQRQEKEAVK